MTDPTNASALNTTTNVTGCTYVLISGATSLTGTTLTFNNDNTVTTNGISVKLYSGGTTNDLSVYSEIDQQLKILWKRAIQNTIKINMVFRFNRLTSVSILILWSTKNIITY